MRTGMETEANTITKSLIFEANDITKSLILRNGFFFCSVSIQI